MSATIRVTIPVYFYETKKRKVLTSMNKFRNWHWSMQNRFKQEVGDYLKGLLADAEPIEGKYSIIYTYHYKNSGSDLTNVCALSSKVLNDVLQEMSIVEGDSVKTLVQETFIVGTKSVTDPRVEAVIMKELS